MHARACPYALFAYTRARNELNSGIALHHKRLATACNQKKGCGDNDLRFRLLDLVFDATLSLLHAYLFEHTAALGCRVFSLPPSFAVSGMTERTGISRCMGGCGRLQAPRRFAAANAGTPLARRHSIARYPLSSLKTVVLIRVPLRES